jgi:hypothetical protein
MINSLISINSSSDSSTSSAFAVGDVVAQMNIKTIASCVVGISKINILSGGFKDISHSALLLLDTDSENTDEDSKGILIEYGDYYPDMSKTEKNFVDNKYVIYQYDSNGGVRFYVNTYKDFKKTFADIGYIELDINVNNQMTFDNFIQTIAPKNGDKWTRAKYGISHNCQDFVVEALNILKPKFMNKDVCPKDPKLLETKEKRISFIPKIIINELKKHKK